jgi:hypothetical protein
MCFMKNKARTNLPCTKWETPLLALSVMCIIVSVICFSPKQVVWATTTFEAEVDAGVRTDLTARHNDNYGCNPGIVI